MMQNKVKKLGDEMERFSEVMNVEKMGRES